MPLCMKVNSALTLGFVYVAKSQCMRSRLHCFVEQNLHVNLKRDHKLKHWGRLQYGLFLKGAVRTLVPHFVPPVLM